METDAPAILIVDDNEDNRYTLQLLLESDGHSRLATASGGHEALALLAREKFSLGRGDLVGDRATGIGFAGVPDQSHEANGYCMLRLKSKPRRVKGDSKPRFEAQCQVHHADPHTEKRKAPTQAGFVFDEGNHAPDCEMPARRR
jgi:CheY-like chemotaxis protein